MTSQAIHWDQMPSEDVRGGVVTVGNFDGVHRGHAFLVEQVSRQAVALGRPAVALTFEPHPRVLLAPAALLPPLTTPADRVELLQALGVHVLVLCTTHEL